MQIGPNARAASILLLLSLIAFAGWAQSDSDRLSNACKLNKSPDERVMCLEALIRLTSKTAQTAPVAQASIQPQAQPQSRSEDASRAALGTAFKAMADLANSMGNWRNMNAYSYRVFVNRAEGPVRAVQLSELTPAGRDAHRSMVTALQAFNDAGDFWMAHSTFFADPQNRSLYIDSLPLERMNLLYLTDRYGVEQKRADLLGLLHGVKLKDGLATIWAKAGDALSVTGAYMTPADATQGK